MGPNSYLCSITILSEKIEMKPKRQRQSKVVNQSSVLDLAFSPISTNNYSELEVKDDLRLPSQPVNSS